MTSMFRTTALAAALAFGWIGAQAAPVPINFDFFGDQASSTKVPVAIGTIKEFQFSNAFAYRPDMLGSDPAFPDLQAPGGTTGTFVMNDDRIPDNPYVAIQIKLTGSYVTYGEYFESVAMDIFSLGNVSVSWFKKGNDSNKADGTFGLSNAVDGRWNPVKNSTNWDATAQIDRIQFSAGDAAYFGIQGLRVGLTTGSRPDPNPNPAPEPAGYALVGLALLAAGAATRRRA